MILTCMNEFIKVRHFLLSDVTFGADGDFSEKKLVESSNAKLANSLEAEYVFLYHN